ncbi:MAG: hypothetical protein R3268_08940 [Acidiferrobacterales bacterium]|nr:hypothetical protein [Acidiferrobacterales bacterium]
MTCNYESYEEPEPFWSVSVWDYYPEGEPRDLLAHTGDKSLARAIVLACLRAVGEEV